MSVYILPYLTQVDSVQRENVDAYIGTGHVSYCQESSSVQKWWQCCDVRSRGLERTKASLRHAPSPTLGWNEMEARTDFHSFGSEHAVEHLASMVNPCAWCKPWLRRPSFTFVDLTLMIFLTRRDSSNILPSSILFLSQERELESPLFGLTVWQVWSTPSSGHTPLVTCSGVFENSGQPSLASSRVW